MAALGIDLLDLYRGGLSIRRLRILIEHFPPESATKVALRNLVSDSDMKRASGEHRPDRAAWSNLEVLVAILCDEIVQLRNVTVVAAGGKATAFHPMSRPGIPPKSAVRSGMSDEQRAVIDPRLRATTQVVEL